MQDETKFGKLLFESSTTPGRALCKRLLYLIPALILIVVGVIFTTRPDSFGLHDEDMIYVYIVFFGVGGILFLLSLFVKRKKFVLYESGLMYGSVSNLTELDFNDIAGIQRKIETTTVMAGGLIGGLITGLLSSIIPGLNTHSIEIYKKDGNWAERKIELSKSKVPNYKQLADEIDNVFTTWLLKDLAMENIGTAEIAFGSDLKLSGGHFIHDKGKKKGEHIIQFRDISGFEFDGENRCWLTGMNTDKKGYRERLVSPEYNTNALVRVVEMITSQNAH